MSKISPVKSSFGQKLKAIREANGIEQQELAKRVGIAPAYLSHIETGRRPAPEIFPEALRMIRQAGVRYGTPEFKALIQAAWADRGSKNHNSDALAGEFSEFEEFLIELLTLIPDGPKLDGHDAIYRMYDFNKLIPDQPGVEGDDITLAPDKFAALRAVTDQLADSKDAFSLVVVTTDGKRKEIYFPPESGRIPGEPPIETAKRLRDHHRMKERRERSERERAAEAKQQPRPTKKEKSERQKLKTKVVKATQ